MKGFAGVAAIVTGGFCGTCLLKKTQFTAYVFRLLLVFTRVSMPFYPRNQKETGNTLELFRAQMTDPAIPLFPSSFWYTTMNNCLIEMPESELKMYVILGVT